MESPRASQSYRQVCPTSSCHNRHRGSCHSHGDRAQFISHIGPNDPVRAAAEILVKVTVTASPKPAEVRANQIKGTAEVIRHGRAALVPQLLVQAWRFLLLSRTCNGFRALSHNSWSWKASRHVCHEGSSQDSVQIHAKAAKKPPANAASIFLVIAKAAPWSLRFLLKLLWP